jgi:hypothetical protein
MYRPTSPPPIKDAETRALAEWLDRELTTIAREFGSTEELELRVRHREPPKPRNGLIVCADGSDWNPGAGGGAYVYFNDAWVKL